MKVHDFFVLVLSRLFRKHRSLIKQIDAPTSDSIPNDNNINPNDIHTNNIILNNAMLNAT